MKKLFKIIRFLLSTPAPETGLSSRQLRSLARWNEVQMKWIRDFLIHDNDYLSKTGKRLNVGLIYALDLGREGYSAGIPVLWTPFQEDRKICSNRWSDIAMYLRGGGDGTADLDENTMALLNFPPGRLFT